MKKKSLSSMSILAVAIILSAPTAPQAEDIEATLNFRGTITNNPGRQSVQGSLRGSGEYDPIDSTAAIRGSIRTAPGQRPAQVTVLGDYPVLLALRARSGDEVESDNFKSNAILFRRYMSFPGYGKIVFKRPINPSRPGRQSVRGRGRFEFNE